ncbi:MAG: DUF4388 domain-containing protein [Acidimicrobiales bacterium]
MSQVQSGSEAAAAALVGSLATFSLVDILDLLARTNHTGELQVVGRGIDQRVWMDQGDLVTSGSSSVDTVLFDLACIEEGWFYFTSGELPPEGGSRSPVTSVLAGVGPQVAEWRDLVARLPFDTVVKMSASTPAAEVQIRGDQWQLLSLVGGGRTVRQVVDASPLHPLDTLRTLGELLTARLITADEHGGSMGPPIEPAPATPLVMTPPSSAPEPAVSEPTVAEAEAAGAGAEVEVEVEIAEGSAGTPLPPFVPPSPSSVPPAPEGWVTTESTNGGPAAEDEAPEATLWSTGTASAGGTPIMPPPISGDPWSSTLSTETGDEDG